MRTLMTLLIVLLVIGVGIELAAPPLVESRMEQRVQDNTEGVVTVNADIDSFPMITRLLATEEIRRATIDVDEIAEQDLPLAAVSLTLEDVVVDRDRLSRGDLQVRSIRTGRLRAEISEQRLSEVLDVPVQIEGGTLRVESQDRTADFDLQFSAGRVRLDIPGVGGVGGAFDTSVLPCRPEATVFDDRIVLDCTFDSVPRVLVRLEDED